MLLALGMEAATEQGHQLCWRNKTALVADGIYSATILLPSSALEKSLRIVTHHGPFTQAREPCSFQERTGKDQYHQQYL